MSVKPKNILVPIPTEMTHAVDRFRKMHEQRRFKITQQQALVLLLELGVARFEEGYLTFTERWEEELKK